MGDIATALGLTSKLITFGVKAWDAVWKGEGKAIAEAVAQLAEALGALPGRPASIPTTAVGAHEALVVGAFTAAWQRHWADNARILKQQKDKAATSLRTAVDDYFKEAASPLATLDGLRGDPTSSRLYQNLRRFFVEDELLEDDEAARRTFLRDFYTAWAVLRAGPVGEPLRIALDGDDHARAVREHLACDFIGWRTRHVFGNQLGHDSLPAMPLEDVYVEPSCGAEGIQTALWSWLEDRTQKPTIAVVQADFGHGKSLSARRFATDLAQAWLSSPNPADAWWPVFIRCAAHYATPDLGAMARRAQQEQLAAAGGPALTDDDPVLAPPSHIKQKVVFILDGLDEVHLDGSAAAALFHHLGGKTADRQRIVVFSRPAAVGELGRKEGVRSFELEPFSAPQIEAWLTRWNTLKASWAAGERPLTLADLQARKLDELAPIPILLFMIAWTWQPEAPVESDVVGIYEQFFLQLARSKCRFDGDPQHRDGHRVVVDATTELHRRLIERRLLLDGSEASEALLWLLGRVAWQHARHAREGQTLLQRHVENVIEQELKLSTGPIFDLIKRGLMLVLPIDPGSHQPVVEFGHRSFREYLVARYWRARLTRRGFGDADERALLGARLMQPESKAFEFLVALIRSANAASLIAPLAEKLFLDDHLGHLDGEASRPSEDLRLHLREAALALRCHLDEAPFCPPEGALRSLTGLFQAQGTWAWLDAPRLHLKGLNLFGLLLIHSQLPEANLRGANLGGANLRGADLGGANLGQARLWGADLRGADLGRADLRGASLSGVHFEGAHLHGTDLRGADLGGAFVWVENLGGANFEGANLGRADLEGADLSGANLSGANLSGANLSGANLSGANLGAGSGRVRGLRRARNLRQARMPAGFSLKKWPQDDD